MNKLEVTWKRTLVIWWSIAWRGILFGAIAGAVVGAIVGFILGFLGRVDLASIGGGIAGYIVAIPISIWVLKIVLSKKFSEFSLQLIAENPSVVLDVQTDESK